MTPKEQDKELREEICKRMFAFRREDYGSGYIDRCIDHLDSVMQLITADRERVALEARIDELERIKILHRKEVYTTKSGDDINIRDRIAELKAQQEEVWKTQI